MAETTRIVQDANGQAVALVKPDVVGIVRDLLAIGVSLTAAHYVWVQTGLLLPEAVTRLETVERYVLRGGATATTQWLVGEGVKETYNDLMNIGNTGKNAVVARSQQILLEAMTTPETK